MKLSFAKTIEGHEIEFVRLMYPLKYELYVRVPNANPVRLTAKKDSKGIWSIVSTNELPAWVNEVSLQIQNTIEENEADVTV